jgi:tRNA(Ile)-lysidine synthase
MNITLRNVDNVDIESRKRYEKMEDYDAGIIIHSVPDSISCVAATLLCSLSPVIFLNPGMPDHSHMSIPNVIERFIARWMSLVPAEASVLVAASGGGDSTALLCMLHEQRERLGIRRLGVLHVNHGLRGNESEGDQRFVSELAKRLECPLFLKKLSDRVLHDAGIEEWGRRERYRFFLETKEREGYDFVATGHTANDQAETVLMRIVRGAGLRGMRGILPMRDDGIVRPMLDLWREEIVGWLKAQGVGFRNDSSNDDRSFGRNRIRHTVLPMLDKREPGALKKLVRIAELSGELWGAMQPAVDRWIATQVKGAAGRFSIEKAGFEDELHVGEGLRRVFEHYGIQADSRHLEEVAARCDRIGHEFLLRGGSWRYYPRRKTVLFINHESTKNHEFNYRIAMKGVTECPLVGARFLADETAVLDKFPCDNLTVAIDRDVCGNGLTFRSMRPDDRFVPLGAFGSVGVESFLAKQGVSKVERPAFGVVEAENGQIIWIPGMRIGQAVRITRNTVRILLLSYQSYSCVII